MKRLFIPLFVVVFLVGCATWKSKATVTYEGIGSMLTTTQQTVRAMCDTGQIKPDDCAKIRDVYNKARQVYIASGDALIAAMNLEATIKNTSDTLQKNQLQQQLGILIAQYQANAAEAIKLAREFQDLYFSLGGN